MKCLYCPFIADDNKTTVRPLNIQNGIMVKTNPEMIKHMQYHIRINRKHKK